MPELQFGWVAEQIGGKFGRAFGQITHPFDLNHGAPPRVVEARSEWLARRTVTAARSGGPASLNLVINLVINLSNR